jgi:HEPN domain-containing protein
VDSVKRKTVEGWIDKASNQLMFAKDKLKSYYHDSECVQAAQECVELSVKAVLEFLDLEYAHVHGWNKEQLERIAKQIRDRHVLERLAAANLGVYVPLPRLLFLGNFWAQFYIQAKYGMEAGYLASAKDLIDHAEAEIAVSHADQCYGAALRLRHLDEQKLAEIAS